MNRFELRKQAIEAIEKEANNGIWQSSDFGDMIICVMDSWYGEERFLGKLEGLVWEMKRRGNVSVEPYVPEGTEDDGSFLKIKVTPRS